MLVFTDFYLGAGAALLTWTASFLQDRPANVLHMATAGLYIQSMYILNHLTNIEANQYEDIFKKDFILQHRRLSMAICLSTGLLSVALAARLGFEEFVLVMSAFAVGVLYHVTLLPENNLLLLRNRRLKDIALSKDLGISIAWSAVCVLSPYEENLMDALMSPSCLTTLLFVFGLVFIRSIFHDLHDIQRDRVVGRETIPILLGRKFRFVFPHPLLILLAVVILFGVLSGFTPPMSAVLVLVPAYLYVVRFLFERNRLTDPLTFDLVVDFMVMMPFALLGLTWLLR
jgi:4-hydroxy-3-methylbut-2-enyl diphosphate reductase